MNSNDKIFKILDDMRKGQQRLEKDLNELKSTAVTRSDLKKAVDGLTNETASKSDFQRLELGLSELKTKAATKNDVRIEITKAKDEFVDILKKEAESTADLFSETWRRYDKTTERITLIEEEIEIMKEKN